MPPSVSISGVPAATSYALDRLARPEISSQAVDRALRGWQDVASRSRSTLTRAHNDWTAFIGPGHRTTLERALAALPRRHANALHAMIQRADQDFCAKTLPNPHADPDDPWWARRLLS